MIFAMIRNDGKEKICCVDKIGKRAFLVLDFFQTNLKELRIDSNQIEEIPETMKEFKECYNAVWTDDMALFFGSNPALGITLDPENDWHPLQKLDQIWSPLEETKGRSLLE